MKQLLCGSRIVRTIKCDNCGLHLSYNKEKRQKELICPKCGNHIPLKVHKY